MDCPFCKEKLNEGELRCHNCDRVIVDFDYFKNLDIMREKYGKRNIPELSKEKLTYPEIITIYTLIERDVHHSGDTDFEDYCRESGVFTNLAKRLEEIRDESKE